LSDLDDTLFDHLHSTRIALARAREVVPALCCWSPSELETRHRSLLEALHLEVLAGRASIEIARVERFRRLLSAAGSNTAAADAPGLARCYREAYERGWQPVAGAVALAEAIKRAGLPLVIVTNNSLAEQTIKLAQCGLTRYVDALVTSEEVGACKPDTEIFNAALERVNVAADAAVMLGDAWATDIEGARGAGIRVVWFNRHAETSPDPTVPEIDSLEPAAHVLEMLTT
jgi:HAD superfamily hydrolase (TIGR01509 family)